MKKNAIVLSFLGGVLSQKQRAAQIEFPLWITDRKMISIHGLSDLTVAGLIT